MAGVEQLDFGFSDAKLERRRPSKRKTTQRTFPIERNWETDQVQPEKSPIKEGSNEQQLPVVGSPVFSPPTPSSQSLKLSCIFTTSNGDTADAEPNNLSCHEPREDDTGHMATKESLATSIVIDENPPVVPLATPEQDIQVTLNVPIAVSPAKTIPDQQQDTKTTDASTSVNTQSLRTTRGSKRKHDSVLSEQEKMTQENDDDDDDVQYSANTFVRIFNADQGRKVTVAEITSLDVALTAIEEVALEYREEVKTDIAKQCIKEFFIHIRKSFGEYIDMQKDYKTLTSDFRRVNSRMKRMREELLEIQKKRTKIRGELEKWETEERENKKIVKDMLEITEYLHQMENIHKSCKIIAKDNFLLDKSLSSNLPSMLVTTKGLLTSASKLRSVNSSLEELLHGSGTTSQEPCK